MINGTKMSKSLGNFLTVKDTLKNYFPEEIRYAILTHNYSSAIDFSDELFLNARKRLYYFCSTLLKINEIGSDSVTEPESLQIPEGIASLGEKFVEFMNDNFNTPRVISEITEIFKELNKIIISNEFSIEEKKYIFYIFLEKFKEIASVFRLFEEDPASYIFELKAKMLSERKLTTDFIEKKLSERQAAKDRKDYLVADDIKEELKQKGVSIQDLQEKVGWDIIF